MKGKNGVLKMTGGYDMTEERRGKHFIESEKRRRYWKGRGQETKWRQDRTRQDRKRHVEVT